MKRLTVFSIILSFLLVLPITALAGIGNFTYVKGMVDIITPGEEARSANKGDEVNIDDIIRSRKRAKAEITFTDGTVVRLARSTRLEITEYLIKKDHTEAKLGLSRGKIQSIVPKVAGKIFGVNQPNKFEIQTPVATCGVRGTDFFAIHDFNDTEAGNPGVRVAAVDGSGGGIPGGTSLFSFREGQGYGFNNNRRDKVNFIQAGQTLIFEGLESLGFVRQAATDEIGEHIDDTTPDDTTGDDTGGDDTDGGDTGDTGVEGDDEGGGDEGGEPPLGYTPPEKLDLPEPDPVTGGEADIKIVVENPKTFTESDKTPPKILISSTTVTGNKVTIVFNINEPGVITYTYDGVTDTITAGTAGNYTITLILDPGEYTLAASAQDIAGNNSSGNPTASLDILPETPSPAPTIVLAVSVDEGGEPVVNITPGENTASYTYELDDGSPSSNPTITGLTKGTHTIKYTAVDPRGNQNTPPEITFEIKGYTIDYYHSEVGGTGSVIEGLIDNGTIMAVPGYDWGGWNIDMSGTFTGEHTAEWEIHAGGYMYPHAEESGGYWLSKIDGISGTSTLTYLTPYALGRGTGIVNANFGDGDWSLTDNSTGALTETPLTFHGVAEGGLFNNTEYGSLYEVGSMWGHIGGTDTENLLFDPETSTPVTLLGMLYYDYEDPFLLYGSGIDIYGGDLGSVSGDDTDGGEFYGYMVGIGRNGSILGIINSLYIDEEGNAGYLSGIINDGDGSYYTDINMWEVNTFLDATIMGTTTYPASDLAEEIVEDHFEGEAGFGGFLDAGDVVGSLTVEDAAGDPLRISDQDWGIWNAGFGGTYDGQTTDDWLAITGGNYYEDISGSEGYWLSMLIGIHWGELADNDVDIYGNYLGFGLTDTSFYFADPEYGYILGTYQETGDSGYWQATGIGDYVMTSLYAGIRLNGDYHFYDPDVSIYAPAVLAENLAGYAYAYFDGILGILDSPFIDATVINDTGNYVDFVFMGESTTDNNLQTWWGPMNSVSPDTNPAYDFAITNGLMGGRVTNIDTTTDLSDFGLEDIDAQKMEAIYRSLYIDASGGAGIIKGAIDPEKEDELGLLVDLGESTGITLGFGSLVAIKKAEGFDPASYYYTMGDIYGEYYGFFSEGSIFSGGDINSTSHGMLGSKTISYYQDDPANPEPWGIFSIELGGNYDGTPEDGWTMNLGGDQWRDIDWPEYWLANASGSQWSEIDGDKRIAGALTGKYLTKTILGTMNADILGSYDINGLGSWEVIALGDFEETPLTFSSTSDSELYQTRLDDYDYVDFESWYYLEDILLGGTQSLWSDIDVSIIALGEAYEEYDPVSPGEGGIWFDDYVYSYNDKDDTNTTYDGGAYSGFLAGTALDYDLDSRFLAIYLDPTGNMGRLHGELAGNMYPDLELLMMEGSVNKEQITTASESGALTINAEDLVDSVYWGYPSFYGFIGKFGDDGGEILFEDYYDFTTLSIPGQDWGMYGFNIYGASSSPTSTWKATLGGTGDFAGRDPYKYEYGTYNYSNGNWYHYSYRVYTDQHSGNGNYGEYEHNDGSLIVITYYNSNGTTTEQTYDQSWVYQGTKYGTWDPGTFNIAELATPPEPEAGIDITPGSTNAYLYYYTDDDGYWLADISNGQVDENGKITGLLEGRMLTERYMGTFTGDVDGIINSTDNSWALNSLGDWDRTPLAFSAWLDVAYTYYDTESDYLDYSNDFLGILGTEISPFASAEAVGGYGSSVPLYLMAEVSPAEEESAWWGYLDNAYTPDDSVSIPEGFIGGRTTAAYDDSGNLLPEPGLAEGFFITLYVDDSGNAGILEGDFEGDFVPISQYDAILDASGNTQAKLMATGFDPLDYSSDDNYFDGYLFGTFNAGGEIYTGDSLSSIGYGYLWSYTAWLVDSTGNDAPWGIYNLELGGYYSTPASDSWTINLGGDDWRYIEDEFWLATITGNDAQWSDQWIEGLMEGFYLTPTVRGTINGKVLGSYDYTEPNAWEAIALGSFGESPLAFYSKRSMEGPWYSLHNFLSPDYFSFPNEGDAGNSEGLLGGITSPWSIDPGEVGTDVAFIGRFYDEYTDTDVGNRAYLFSEGTFSYNASNMTNTTYDDGAFAGFISGIFANEEIALHVLNLYMDPSGDVGFLTGDLSGNYYPELGEFSDYQLHMFEAHGSKWDVVQINSDFPLTTTQNTFVSNIFTEQIVNAYLYGEFNDNIDSYINGSLHAGWTKNITGQPWGVYNLIFDGYDDGVRGFGYSNPDEATEWTAYMSSQTGFTNSFSEAIIKGTWENGEIHGQVTGSWVDVDLDYGIALTGVSGGELFGSYDLDGDWQALSMGAWLETGLFLDMVGTDLERLNIPYAEIGSVNLTLAHEDPYFDAVNLNNVVFFAYSTGEFPLIWATKDVNGNYNTGNPPPDYGSHTVTLSGDMIIAEFTVTEWNSEYSIWAAYIDGAGFLSNSEPIPLGFYGNAAGEFFDGSFWGTASGLTEGPEPIGKIAQSTNSSLGPVYGLYGGGNDEDFTPFGYVDGDIDYYEDDYYSIPWIDPMDMTFYGSYTVEPPFTGIINSGFSSYIWSSDIYSYNDADGSSTTPDNGAFHGFVGGYWMNNQIDGLAAALYVDPDGNVGILYGKLDEGYYFSTEDGLENMFMADGYLNPIKLANLGIDPTNFNNNILIDVLPEATITGTYITGVTTSGWSRYLDIPSLNLDDGSFDNRVWGVYDFIFDGTYDSDIGSSWQASISTNGAEAPLWLKAQILNGLVDPITGAISGDVAGAWVDIEGVTGVLGGDLKGVFDPANNWQATSLGTFIDTKTFMDMVNDGKFAELQNLNIPCAEIGKTTLTGNNGNLDVTMTDVTFFAYTAGQSPEIWATDKVDGTFGTLTVNEQVTLSGAGFDNSVNFKVNSVNANDATSGTWAAGVAGSGTVGGHNITVEGGAAGIYNNNDLAGTAAGVSQPIVD